MLPASCFLPSVIGYSALVAFGVRFVPPSTNHKSLIKSRCLLPLARRPLARTFGVARAKDDQFFRPLNTQQTQVRLGELSTFLSLPMKRPEKVAGHDVSDDAQQHQKNRHPENPTVVHSPPARSVRMTVVMLVTMVLIVHTKEAHYRHRRAWKRKRSEPDWRFHDKLAFPYPVNAVERAYHFDV
jgi:hypothetical protein